MTNLIQGDNFGIDAAVFFVYFVVEGNQGQIFSKYSLSWMKHLLFCKFLAIFVFNIRGIANFRWLSRLTFVNLTSLLGNQ